MNAHQEWHEISAAASHKLTEYRQSTASKDRISFMENHAYWCAQVAVERSRGDAPQVLNVEITRSSAPNPVPSHGGPARWVIWHLSLNGQIIKSKDDRYPWDKSVDDIPDPEELVLLRDAIRAAPPAQTAASSDGPEPVPYEKLEAEMLAVIDEREAAQACIDGIYFNILGRAPGWSNMFGFTEAVDEITETVASFISGKMPDAAPTTSPEPDAVRAALEPFAKYEMLIIGDPFSLKKGDLKDCDYVVGFAGPVQPEFRHFAAAKAALSAPVAGADIIERCAKVADAMTIKWGNPNGSVYAQGMQDQGIRIASQIRALATTRNQRGHEAG